ncbi:hypothetical protein BH10PSE7_BH10PSE7_08080 [soil metagenome]
MSMSKHPLTPRARGARPSPARGEGKEGSTFSTGVEGSTFSAGGEDKDDNSAKLSVRQIELRTRIMKKRLSLPSPLAGEGGVRSTTGEGAVATSRPRQLREAMTEAEGKLWLALRDRRFAECKFRRQAPIGRYIADFLSFELRLVVEVDGGQHAESTTDDHRDRWLRDQGYTVLRVWNADVLTNLDGVLEAIAEHVARAGKNS